MPYKSSVTTNKWCLLTADGVVGSVRISDVDATVVEVTRVTTVTVTAQPVTVAMAPVTRMQHNSKTKKKKKFIFFFFYYVKNTQEFFT